MLCFETLVRVLTLILCIRKWIKVEGGESTSGHIAYIRLEGQFGVCFLVRVVAEVSLGGLSNPLVGLEGGPAQPDMLDLNWSG